MNKLTKNLIVAAVLLAGFAAAIGSYVLLAPDTPSSTALDVKPAAEAKPVRDSSHRLSDPANSELTFVEFLDFECEACGAYYPLVEQLRKEYGDRVTFVARYFPMPGHRNGELAARTAEAAARQGKFEAMYNKLFTTQKAWGEAQESKQQLFRGYAKQIGLDLAKFDADLKDPAVAKRVQADQRDGLGLGVQGTPTFFIGGKKITNPESYDAFKKQVEAGLAAKK
ncbi:protein-disulfide isomerase-like protein [Streptomyces zinciresistens K42]|uniref:Protein-disulfide isomerase-like protein n=1 Tax=Streptomyces zinciresistens K42 TaxID=700597 RepID=G2GIF2_9ACTN|nr:thioredoxin domain-containing protein [Streptomyces zinciresistens]EGX56718.1 protein-disulfide isomerase-like protein [Streptomyces zinciresistens K42]